ncbi:hypothetical protein PSENEW3n2_00000840 [Picochlorum sp. SENEW3]|nr:hypothetical protein PSENEW3n2_00000840 [Picochlorum sp. SENEW3]WPT15762.1 hypothetical protein PSENEW3_00000840 [Picochlorum sp. SENEW3]
MVIIANNPVYKNALYGSTPMNVGKVYPRHIDRHSDVCDPEKLACYPSDVASIRKQHISVEDTAAPTAHTPGEPDPTQGAEDATDDISQVAEQFEVLRLPKSDIPITAENTIFPYLFPKGKGHFIPPQGKQSFYTTSQRKFTLTDAYKRRRISHPQRKRRKLRPSLD